MHHIYIYIIGELGGLDAVTLLISEIPVHSHSLIVSNVTGNTISAADTFLATTPTFLKIYYEGAPDTNLDIRMMEPAGASEPHTNMGPYLSLSFFICTNKNGCSGMSLHPLLSLSLSISILLIDYYELTY